MRIMTFARLAIIVALIVTYSVGLHAGLWAQQLSLETWSADILPDMQGDILQMSFPLGVGIWEPYEQGVPKYSCTKNCVALWTVDDVTYLSLSDSHDICKKGPNGGPCTFSGAFTTPLSVSLTPPSSSGVVWGTWSGQLLGTFSVAGWQETNIQALFEFNTYPAVIGDPQVPAVGSLILVFQDN